MNELRETEAILALHELGYSTERVAELMRLPGSRVASRIRRASKKNYTVESLQEAVLYWQGHAKHFKHRYDELKGKGASRGKT